MKRTNFLRSMTALFAAPLVVAASFKDKPSTHLETAAMSHPPGRDNGPGYGSVKSTNVNMWVHHSVTVQPGGVAITLTWWEKDGEVIWTRAEYNLPQPGYTKI